MKKRLPKKSLKSKRQRPHLQPIPMPVRLLLILAGSLPLIPARQ